MKSDPLSQQPVSSELLTVDQFAQLLKVSRTTVFSWLKTGEIQEGVHFIRLGRVLRFRWQIELLFVKKPQSRTKQKQNKRPTSPGRKLLSADLAVNLDYGALTV
jgi:excisionase family DNA binding protein